MREDTLLVGVRSRIPLQETARATVRTIARFFFIVFPPPLECKGDAAHHQALLGIVTVVHARGFWVYALRKSVYGEQVLALHKDAESLDSKFLGPLLGEGVTKLGGLQAHILTVSDPESGAEAVVAAVVGLCQGEPGERSAGIELAVGVLNQEQRGVASFLEGLGPDGVVVVVVVVSTGEGYVKEGAPRELGVEVEALPAKVEIEAEGEFRTVAAPEEAFVVLIDLAVTVEVYVADVAKVGAGSLPGGIVNLLLRAV